MKSNKQKLLIIIFFIIISVVSCLYIYNTYKDNKVNKDANKFSQEYRMVDSKNNFKYRTSSQMFKILEEGTGILYLGFPQCKWCQYYVKLINEVAKEEGVNIYYYNIYNDRKDNTDVYKKFVSFLSGNLQFDDNGKERIYVPHISVVVKGKIIETDYETSFDTDGLDDPEKYWTDSKKENLKNKLKTAFQKVYVELNSCSDCNN